MFGARPSLRDVLSYVWLCIQHQLSVLSIRLRLIGFICSPSTGQYLCQISAIVTWVLSVMEWYGRRTGHRQQSQSKMETTAGRGSNQVLLYSSRKFSARPKFSLARIDKRGARAARNSHYHYNQIGPLDHKMADNCVSLACTNTVSSAITK